MSGELDTFYSVLNKPDFLSIDSETGNLIRHVEQDQSTDQYTAVDFHKISRDAGHELAEKLDQYKTDEIIASSELRDSEPVRLTLDELLGMAFSRKLSVGTYDAASVNFGAYLPTVTGVFSKLWSLVDGVIRLETTTDTLLPNQQQIINENNLLINFIKDNTLKPFVKALSAYDFTNEGIKATVIDQLTRAINIPVNLKIGTLKRGATMPGGDASLVGKFIETYTAIMKDVFGDDVKLAE